MSRAVWAPSRSHDIEGHIAHAYFDVPRIGRGTGWDWEGTAERTT